jgi:TolB protein
MPSRAIIRLAVVAFGLAGCGQDAPPVDDQPGVRADGARRLEVEGLSGSLQNPCWSPQGDRIALTNFRGGYNEGPSAVVVVDADGGAATAITPGVSDEVNMPASCWDAASGRIVFTTDQTATEHDEVFVVPEDGGDPVQVTDRPDRRAFEPTFAPDGEHIVFESHALDQDEDGELWTIRVDGSELVQLTSPDTIANARQPVWSPTGDAIVFQAAGVDGLPDVWTIAPDGTGLFNVTESPSEDTDASFSPDGRYIVYSSDQGGLDLARIHVIPKDGGTPMPVTATEAYDGAPGWGPDGVIAFESYAGDPDESPRTVLYLVDAPAI